MDIQRRHRRDLWTDAEKAIQDAIGAVEKAGASVLLTSAVVLLCNAKELVADHVEGKSASDADFAPPVQLKCPRCQGQLKDSGKNIQGNIRFVDCSGECGHCWTIVIQEETA